MSAYVDPWDCAADYQVAYDCFDHMSFFSDGAAQDLRSWTDPGPSAQGFYPWLGEASPEKFNFHHSEPPVCQFQRQNELEMCSARESSVGLIGQVTGCSYYQDGGSRTVAGTRGKSNQPKAMTESKRKSVDARYKTALCQNPEFTRTGRCPFGWRCNFAHGERELQRRPSVDKYKTLRCLYSTKEQCSYKEKCTFAHMDDKDGVWEKARVGGATKNSDVAFEGPQTMILKNAPHSGGSFLRTIPSGTNFFGPEPQPALKISDTFLLGDGYFADDRGCESNLNSDQEEEHVGALVALDLKSQSGMNSTHRYGLQSTLGSREMKVTDHFWSILDELEKEQRTLLANRVRKVIRI